MLKIKSRWFEYSSRGGILYSIKKVKNLKEAWKKTKEKWGLKMEGWRPYSAASSCGLCDLYNEYGCTENSKKCPLSEVNYGIIGSENEACVPYRDKPELEYLFLLIVREASKGGR